MTNEDCNQIETTAVGLADDEALKRREMRCVQCDSPVYNVVCGRKSPCPVCGFPYPIGDCSDLAEN